MKKWYRHAAVKLLLLLTVLMTAVIGTLSFVLLAGPGYCDTGGRI